MSVVMVYVVERKRDDGTPRYLAQYRDPEGRIRSAGTFFWWGTRSCHFKYGEASLMTSTD